MRVDTKHRAVVLDRALDVREFFVHPRAHHEELTTEFRLLLRSREVFEHLRLISKTTCCTRQTINRLLRRIESWIVPKRSCMRIERRIQVAAGIFVQRRDLMK